MLAAQAAEQRVQGVEGAGATQRLGLRHPVEAELRGIRRLLPHLVLERGNAHARRSGRHEERRHPTLAGCRVGDRENDDRSRNLP